MTFETIFWIVAAILSAVAVFAVLWALMRKAPDEDGSLTQELSREALAEQLRVLDEERAAGLVTDSIYESSVTDVQRRALEELAIDEKHVKRTGLDYWPHVDLKLWDSLEELIAQADPHARFWYLSTKATHCYWDAEFHNGDYFVFGPETKGLPESLLAESSATALRIPMPGKGSRSLNLSTSVAIVLYEGMRQCR